MEIRQTQANVRGKYRSYSASDLHEAYAVVVEQGLPVERVAKRFNIPITTLKDRVKGRVHIDTVRSGPQTMFTLEQEAFLCKHLMTMAKIGFGYSRQETINLATDYAVHLGIREKSKPFSLTWLYSFLNRWPELKVKKPRSLEIARAKYATRPTIDRYFNELNSILTKYNLKDKPSHILNIDEKGLNLEHKPPKIVAGAHYKTQAVTAGRSKTVTVIGGGNALGQQIPPFFIFPGARMQPALMEGAAPEADGTVSESGWSNTEIFGKYMKEHVEPLLPARNNDSPVLILYDGHKSHVSLGLVEWARDQHIVLFVLPPHCSHLLQPMDVSCFGPFEVGWNAACHHHMRESGGRVVTRYEVGRIASKVYSSTLTPLNIQSAFRRCGIYPFDPDVINDKSIAPSLTFHPRPESSTCPDELQGDKSDPKNETTMSEARIFLEKRGGQILENVTVAKVRRTLSKVVGGKPITEDTVFENMKDHVAQQKTPSSRSKTPKKHQKKDLPLLNIPKSPRPVQQPSTSSNNRKADVESPASIISDSGDEDDTEVCSVCGRFTPTELKYCVNLTLVKWGCCDKCDKWVHLRFCSPVKVLRRNDPFLCPKCTEEE
ncbi:uncharacterized protein LOC128550038 [Mercenaria mercenaria]|uniref:uncharacterized protein LOC128550038 n=1 Tax=Mercenaria mercenaria TaxID=6596 RepID=UPI00234E7875|nr:uncharacterized protein LOC128550038 [Mercenaria mercenaria]